MGVVAKKVEWFPKINPTGLGTDLTKDIVTLVVKRATDVKTNNFTITIHRPKAKHGTNQCCKWEGIINTRWQRKQSIMKSVK